MFAFAKANKENAITLLEEVVNINSGTMNHEGVARVGQVFKREFETLGFTTAWHDMSEADRARRNTDVQIDVKDFPHYLYIVENHEHA